MILFYSIPNSFADVFVIIAEKEQKKKSSSWNLLDWMETKKQFALMDQWLALNTNKESLFEGYIGSDQGKYDFRSIDSTSKKTMLSGSLGLFVSLFGLEGQYEKSNERFENYNYQASLRIFGPYKQSTNITMFYGIRDQKTALGEKLQNQYWGGSATVYLFRFLGGEFLYRKYLKGETSLQKRKITGSLTETSAFIDIYFLRFYGTLFKERTHEVTTLGNESDFEREGVKLGLKVFF